MTAVRLGLRLPEGGENVAGAVEAALAAERMGFDSVWLGEHHGYSTYWPSPHMVLMAIAARTESLRLGTNVLLLPLADPVRLAGEWALLDRLSTGRGVLGVGVGWDRAESIALGRDPATRGDRADGYIELMRRLWTGEPTSWEDTHRAMESFLLSPVPGSPLRVWVGGRSEAAKRRAATGGDAWFPDAALSLTEVCDGFEAVDRHRDGAGMAPHSDRPLVRHVVLAGGREEARALAEHHIASTHRQHRQRGNPMVAAAWEDIDTWMENRLVMGNASECADQLVTIARKTGATDLILKIASTPDAATPSLLVEAFSAATHRG